MRKMEKETVCNMFSADVSPELVLLGVDGLLHAVASPDRAERALELANELHALGGLARMTSSLELGQKRKSDMVLVYYKSDSPRLKVNELSLAAREISRSQVRVQGDEEAGTKDIYVTGTRAVVYPKKVSRNSDVAAFLVSKTVWYNNNRAVTDWPSSTMQDKLFLDDINTRLIWGDVTLAR
jgi:hypothetical protein